jgi:hypothetical protein
MEPLPDTGFLPLDQATPAGHPRAEAQLLRQVFPRDASLQHEDDPLQD